MTDSNIAGVPTFTVYLIAYLDLGLWLVQLRGGSWHERVLGRPVLLADDSPGCWLWPATACPTGEDNQSDEASGGREGKEKHSNVANLRKKEDLLLLLFGCWC
jgi:hypothetical protein